MELFRPPAAATFVSFPMADATGFALSGKTLTGTWMAWGDTAGPNQAGNPGFRNLTNTFLEVANTAVYAGQLTAAELPAASPYVMLRFTATNTATQYLLIRTASVYANVSGIQGTNIATPAVAGYMPTDAFDQLVASHTVAGSFGERLGVLHRGTAASGSLTYITLAGSASALDNFYKDRLLYCTGGTGALQAAWISSYVGSTKGASFYAPVVTAFDSTSVINILPSAAFGPDTPTAAEIVNAVWATPSRTVTGGTVDTVTTVTTVSGVTRLNANAIQDASFKSDARQLLANLAWATASRVITGGGSTLGPLGIDDATFTPGAKQMLANLAWATASRTITGHSTAAKAEINAEVVDALSVDTYAEPGQEAPAATASLATKISYLFKGWRNRKTQSNTQFKLYADDATTVDQKATFSDDQTTADRGEMGTGP
jgi:hypothetical protein